MQTLISRQTAQAFISSTKTKSPIVKHHYTNAHIPPARVSSKATESKGGNTLIFPLHTHINAAHLMLLSDSASGKTHFWAGSRRSVIKTRQTKDSASAPGRLSETSFRFAAFSPELLESNNHSHMLHIWLPSAPLSPSHSHAAGHCQRTLIARCLFQKTS